MPCIDIINITENDDGSMNITFDIDKETASAFIKYALKDILMKAAQDTIDKDLAGSDEYSGC